MKLSAGFMISHNLPQSGRVRGEEDQGSPRSYFYISYVCRGGKLKRPLPMSSQCVFCLPGTTVRCG